MQSIERINQQLKGMFNELQACCCCFCQELTIRALVSQATPFVREKKAEGSGDYAYSNLSPWNGIVNSMAQPQTTGSIG